MSKSPNRYELRVDENLAKECAVSERRPIILVVGPTPPPYHGVSTVVSNILKSSVSESFRILHLDTADRRSLNNVGNLDIQNIWLALKHALRFQYLLITEQPDLIYTSIAEVPLGFMRDSLFLIPARLSGKAVVVHLHGGNFDSFYRKSNPLLKSLVRFCLSRVDQAVVLGYRFRDKFDGLVDPAKVRIVPNGIPAKPYEEQGTLQPKDKFRILFMGNLIESKGFVDFIEAAPIVLSNMRGVEFQLVGDDSFPEAQRAKEWVRSRGLEGDITFLGIRHGEEKTAILRSADLFVFPTRYAMEGQPLVLLESMAAGVPIVTTRHATIEDTLGTEGALYVNQGDPVDIANKIMTLLRDGAQRDRIAEHNRVRLREHYTLEQFASNLTTVFMDALDCRKLSHV